MTRIGLFLINLIIVILLFFSGNVKVLGAEENIEAKPSIQLNITPERCVALRQGQTCYQQIVFNWSSVEKGDFCLIETSQNNTLYCWEQKAKGLFNYDFQAQQSHNFVMRAKGSNANLAQQQVTVAWVYKSSKRPKASWRLF